MSDSSVPAAPSRPRWRSWLARFGRRTLDIVYPAHCPGCGAGTAEPGTLCGTCWHEVSFIARPYCERLGIPFSVDIGGTLLSPAAIAEPPVFGRARAVALHEGHARAFVHRLKFSDRLDLAQPMGRMMAAAGRELIDGADAIIPVPLHWTRLMWRRFNQSQALAEAVGTASGLPVMAGALIRKKRTPQQIGLTRNQRIANLQGAFGVTERARMQLRGKALILVDDVHTTGATLNAAARVLLRAGAERVDVLTFTKVADPMKNPI
ncbi:MAG: ComF family protein [Proteobacteria bacterium]|nr:ComF family protein [Pseudomonadota bacterium]